MVRLSSSLFVVVLIGIILCPDLSSALGINCRGSGGCTGIYSLNRLTNKVCNSIPQDNIFQPGVRIATDCVASSGIAAFVQSTSQVITGLQACQLLRGLQDHGCKVCGSNPINPGNDVKNGQLTVNFVGACG